MKQVYKNFTLIVALATSVVLSSATLRAPGLKLADIRISKGVSKAVHPGCSQKTLISTFGKPVQIKKYNFETDDKMGYVIIYDGANFYFEDKGLMDFEITKPGFNLTFGHPEVLSAVGKSIAILPSGFDVKCRDNKCAKVYDLKRADNVTTDRFLEYDYGNSNQKVIKKIILGGY
ncbi:MAG: hypothetical protein JWP94_139 [Mucilaginibacter sp.]|nr:hypothetical protein [Mucilaginibacter sp.]